MDNQPIITKEQQDAYKAAFLQSLFLLAGKFHIDPKDVTVDWEHGVIDVHADETHKADAMSLLEAISNMQPEEGDNDYSKKNN